MKLCECGCGRPAPIAKHTRKALGHVKGQPVRFVVGHHNRKHGTDTYAVEDRGYITPCHIWQGRLNDRGYGVLAVDRRETLAHRKAWQDKKGPVPVGLELDHLCRQRACGNVDHLEPVTHAENVRRAAAVVTHCPQGHEYTPENTYTPPRNANERQCRTCRADVRARRRKAA